MGKGKMLVLSILFTSSGSSFAARLPEKDCYQVTSRQAASSEFEICLQRRNLPLKAGGWEPIVALIKWGSHSPNVISFRGLLLETKSQSDPRLNDRFVLIHNDSRHGLPQEVAWNFSNHFNPIELRGRYDAAREWERGVITIANQRFEYSRATMKPRGRSAVTAQPPALP